MDQLPFWRDLALVVLALETIVLVLVPTICFYYAIRGSRWALQNGRPYFWKVQRWFSRVQETTERTAGGITEPVIRMRVLPARVKGVWRGLSGASQGQG